ncbi:MAG TPA: nucleotidyltransferase domain-containing protein [Candidatus Lokiarchaeia archaeon]|jgi:predicted nucleotidyltransferase
MIEKNNKISKINNILEEAKEILFKLYKAKLIDILLYGSYARGEEHEESDIDLAVIVNKNIKPFKEIDRIIDEIYGIDLKYNVVLSIHPISYKKFLKLNTPFLLNLKQEGISLCQT